MSVYAVHPAPAMDLGLVRETGGRPQTPVARGVGSMFGVVTADELGSGTYFHELEPARAHDQAYDEEARRRLRSLSESFVSGATGAARPEDRRVPEDRQVLKDRVPALRSPAMP